MEPIRCEFCDERHDDDLAWHETRDGLMICDNCQANAAAHHGQILDNIKHMRLFDDLIYAWSGDNQ